MALDPKVDTSSSSELLRVRGTVAPLPWVQNSIPGNPSAQLSTECQHHHHVRLSPHAVPHSSSVVPNSNSQDFLRPQTRLRRKKQSITAAFAAGTTTACATVAGEHMRKLPGIPKSPSYPTFQSKLEPTQPRPSSSGGPNTPSTPLLRTHSNPGPHRSPIQRRPPASHSSYGVETTCGPPPSYSTQRTLSQERIRTIDPRATFRVISPADCDHPELNESMDESQVRSITDPSLKDNPQEPTKQQTLEPDISSPDTLDTRSVSTPQDSVNMTPPVSASSSRIHEDARITAQGLGVDGMEEDSRGTSSDEQKSSEDLFLNIAKSDAGRALQPTPREDKRRSRISLPFFSTSRPAVNATSSPIRSHIDSSTLTPRGTTTQYFTKRSSLGGHIPGALSRPHLEEEPSEDRLPDSQPSRPVTRGDEHPRIPPRRNSNVADTLRPSQRAQLGRNNRLTSESGFNDRLRMPEQVATESTISTTAPSTVWDELDDLKSRIRKLELTGKLPSSSAAAMTTSERPKTATTAATTMSSSPKQKPGVTTLSSAIEGIPSTVHPLLHEALSNARSVVSNEVYQKLQATAQDALQLSSMMSQETYAGGSNLPIATERQVRRRTESMCRSLTELAIAMLAESKPTASADIRPGSRQTFTGVSGLRSRRYSNEPIEQAPAASRVQSRLDSRRTSLRQERLAQAGTDRISLETTLQTPPAANAQVQPLSSSRLNRPSTRSRLNHTGVGGTTDNESSPAARPASRAMTEIGGYRNQVRDRMNFSREYTSQDPMPAQADTNSATRTPLPSNMASSLHLRRKHRSPGGAVGTQDNSPVTPKEPWGRISIIPGQGGSVEVPTPDSGSITRTGTTRRSLGFASRISNVGSRLRAARAERNGKEGTETRSPREIAPSNEEAEALPQLRREESQQFES